MASGVSNHGPMNVFIPGLSYVRGEDNDPGKARNDDLYKLTQEQRRLERSVRYAKRDAAMYDAAGDKEAFEKAALRVKQANVNLKQFVNSHDSLVLNSDRTWVSGYNRSVSGKATKAYNFDLHKRFKGYFGTRTVVDTAKKYKSIVDAGDERLLSGFIRAVDKGDINVLVGIDEYIFCARSIEKELLGLVSVDGTQLKAYTTHFIDRMIGQTSERKEGMRTGVPIEKIKETIVHGSVERTSITSNGKKSVKIVLDDVAVTINPDTGSLIQTNPRR